MIQPYLKSAGRIKKVKTSTLRNKADKLFQEWGRLTYDKCLVCGGEYSCLHHYHPKSTSTALRYDTDNGIPICAGDHLKHHCGNPDIQNTINMKMGLEWVEEMEHRKYTLKVKPDNQWYLANIERLQGMINALK